MLPIMGMKEPWRYRNKAQFPFGLDKMEILWLDFMQAVPMTLLSVKTVC